MVYIKRKFVNCKSKTESKVLWIEHKQSYLQVQSSESRVQGYMQNEHVWEAKQLKSWSKKVRGNAQGRPNTSVTHFTVQLGQTEMRKSLNKAGTNLNRQHVPQDLQDPKSIAAQRSLS